MFTKAEKFISSRNLKPKKKEGFLKIISIFSFLGIMLGVSILIIVMSVMNGFRADLTNKILGLNPHLTIQSNGYKIDEFFILNLEKKYKNFKISKSLTGEGIIINNENAKGIIIKGIEKKDLSKYIKIKNFNKGNVKDFGTGTVLIGGELAFNLNLKLNDKINVMSSAFVNTPAGSLPKQESFIIKGIFNSGFFEFDQNLIFILLDDSISLFEKTINDIDLEIFLPDPIKAEKLKIEVQDINKNYFVYSWNEVNKSFFSALKVERNVMFIILTLIIVVAAFNIISGLTILIKNKTKEIAIIKTLGLSNKSIVKSFFLTGFTIGLFATIMGVIIGTIFSIYIENIRQILSSLFNLNIFPPDVYFLDQMPSEINILSIFIISIFSLGITAISSYFPARLISKLEPSQALKYE